MSSRRGKGFVEKCVPANPKYQHVRHRVDSGASVRRYLERMQESQLHIKQKSDEVFKRIKITSFVKLVVEVFNETLKSQGKDPCLAHSHKTSMPLHKKEIQNNQTYALAICSKSNESCRSSINCEPKIIDEDKVWNKNKSLEVAIPRANSITSVSTRSTLQSVINGTGEMDFKYNIPSVEIARDTVNEPYVLLDVRDSDAYHQCHIITAKSYPYSMLIRTCNYETKEMLACKNVKDKIIVIYDEDESVAPRVATTLVQRGYGNIFMLSGGLKLALYRFPEGLIEGTPPVSFKIENLSIHKTSQMKKAASNLSSKNCFTADSLEILRVQLEKCFEVEASHKQSRSAQSFVRKSTFHLAPLTSKERVMPWK